MVDVEVEQAEQYSDMEEDEMAASGSEAGSANEEDSSGDEEVELLSSEAEGAEDDEDKESIDKEDEDAEDKTTKVEAQFSGWADSISKILKSTKPKNKRELILSRARKDYEVSKSAREPRKRPQDTLEIIPNKSSKLTEDENVGEETIKKEKDDNVLSFKVQRKLELKQKKLELAWENLARLSVEKTEPQVERDLAKIATKGVVQLFNAISMQQKTIKTKLRTSKKSEFQKDKILNQTKDVFDDAMSKSKKLGKANEPDIEIKEEEASSDDDVGSGMTASITIKRKSGSNKAITNTSTKKKKPLWNALQDDFMLDAKLKDWDKDSDSD